MGKPCCIRGIKNRFVDLKNRNAIIFLLLLYCDGKWGAGITVFLLMQIRYTGMEGNV